MKKTNLIKRIDWWLLEVGLGVGEMGRGQKSKKKKTHITV